MVVIGLVKVRKPWHPLHADVVMKLVTVFVVGHSSSIYVLSVIWQLDQPLVLDTVTELYAHDPSTLSRILDVSQELKALTAMLDHKTAGGKAYDFAIDLAALASRREFLNLEKWLGEKFAAAGDGDAFVRGTLEYLSARMQLMAGSDMGGVLPLSEDVVVAFLKALVAQSAAMSAANKASLTNAQAAAAKVYPSVASIQPPQAATDASSVTASDAPAFAADVEEKANSYYEKIYTGDMTIADVIELLKVYKVSK